MLPAGVICTARGVVVAQAAGHLTVQAGDHIKVLCSATQHDGWVYGSQLSVPGECGWVPFDVLLPLSEARGEVARGSLVRSRVAVPAPAGYDGYLPLAEGLAVLVEYVGSSATGDDGWLFGRVQHGEETGWFPSAAVRVVGEAVQLSIGGLSGVICNIAAERNWTILEAKSAIEAATGISWNEQRLFSGTVEVQDADILPVADDEIISFFLVRQNEHSTWSAMVEDNPQNLRRAPPSVQADREVVLHAVQRDGHLLNFASQALKTDHAIAMAAVRQNGLAVSCLSEELRADRTIAMAAVQQEGLALDFLPDNFQEERNIVLAAIRQNWRALEFVSPQLRQDDVDVCIVAVRQSEDAMQYVHGFARAECRRLLFGA